MTDGRPIVFVDTETTALGPLARPWEIAVIRREPDGSEDQFVAHVQYGFRTLPAGTHPMALHVGGWLVRGIESSAWMRDELPIGARGLASPDEGDVARAVHGMFDGRPLMVGVGVHFDVAVLSAMFLRHGLPWEPWHYSILDLKAASWGNVVAHAAMGDDHLREQTELPVSSDRIAAAMGVAPPPDDERHTALGDARWAARWFDVLVGGGPR